MLNMIFDIHTIKTGKKYKLSTNVVSSPQQPVMCWS
uniref:Uncharacterized protein n=1 Tax=Anguilla anguilla TaxID=7936 RepID=A0A0E9PAL2_ANGAN